MRGDNSISSACPPALARELIDCINMGVPHGTDGVVGNDTRGNGRPCCVTDRGFSGGGVGRRRIDVDFGGGVGRVRGLTRVSADLDGGGTGSFRIFLSDGGAGSLRTTGAAAAVCTGTLGSLRIILRPKRRRMCGLRFNEQRHSIMLLAFSSLSAQFVQGQLTSTMRRR